MAVENHSNMPKARLELRDGNKLHKSHQTLLNGINSGNHDEPISVPKVSSNLYLLWFPQIPCNPYKVEVKNVEDAAFLHEVLAKYDLFLLNDCINMRVDYCNSCDLVMPDPDPDSEYEDIYGFDGPMTSWYLEDEENGNYFSDFDEYLREMEHSVITTIR